MNHTLLSSAVLPVAPGWRRWLRQQVTRGHWRRWRRLLTAFYIIAATAGLHDYISVLSAQTGAGVLALLYMPAFEKHPPESLRFGWPALFFIALFFVAPVKTTLYLAMACAACLMLETFYRRVAGTTPFILLLLSPIATFFAESFSFPIRLCLTALAGRLIALSGLPTVVEGNAITVRDHAFSVDPACAGLHMLVLSGLAALLLMNYYQSHYQRRLPAIPILLLLTAVTMLNMVANLLRMICLVLLAIGPDNPLHNIIGLVFLVGYILLPMLPLTRWTIRRFGKTYPGNAAIPPSPSTGKHRPSRSRMLLTINIISAAAILLLVGLRSFSQKAHGAGLAPGDHVPGYTIKEREDAVLQLDNGRCLVYIKPIPGFYYTDHTPTLCWLGSGYSFSAVEEGVVAGTTIFKATMETASKKQRLYTAWWYDNGVHQSIRPFEWRWDLIRGAPAYSVINVTASTPQDLQTELTTILSTHPFRSLLGRPPAPARVKIW